VALPADEADLLTAARRAGEKVFEGEGEE